MKNHGRIYNNNPGISKVNQKSFDELSIKDLHELVDAGLSLSAASKYFARKINLTKNVI